ncbi:MAG: polyprenyl synthetase family protein [Ezakiella sp.]|nr:polyprenyl synthetase family protein [Ezakiella sp.]MDD7471876.1 polyprenyl synthetase family protein [Bacillota bacterium]MDY3923840.1 polyprenyl synthetase family protein [Ezakiella sp.]
MGIELYKKDLNEFLIYLEAIIDRKSLDSNILKEAIKYSVFRGGKRLRPICTFATANALKKSSQEVFNLAAVIELIHNYSLVHDDMPELDNDNYRRGQLSTHKKFGNGIGLLSGDAIFSLAVETSYNDDLNKSLDDKYKAYGFVFEKAGATGMIDGQAFEMNIEPNEDNYYKVIDKKTASLFIASFVGTALYFGVNNDIDKLNTFAKLFGEVFQIKDDIADKDFALMKKDADIHDILYKKCEKLNKSMEELSDTFDIKYFKLLVDFMMSF